MANTYKLTIYCSKFPTLKNAKQFRFNKTTRRMFISSSDDFAEWYLAASLQVNAWKGGCKYPLPFKRCSITIIIFFPNMRQHDIDGVASGVLDLLKTPTGKKKNQKGCSVILDDDWKLLRPILIDAGISPNTPRVEVFITPVDDIAIRTK